MKQRLPLAYNQAVAKHVESLFFPYLDESSNLSGSTELKTPESFAIRGFFSFRWTQYWLWSKVLE